MKKNLVIFILSIMLLPITVFAGGNNDDKYCGDGYDLINGVCRKYLGPAENLGDRVWTCDKGEEINHKCYSTDEKISVCKDGYEYVKGKCGKFLGIAEPQGTGTYTCQKGELVGSKCYQFDDEGVNVQPNKGENNSTNNPGTNGNIPEYNCESLLGDPNIEGTTSFYLVVIFKVLKYVAIILLLVLSIMDFVGAVASSDSDIMKKAVNKLVKRAIFCVIIFILPTLIELILGLINDNAVASCDIW